MAILKFDGIGQVDKRRCRVCGCTQFHACPSGCYWVTDDLCSKCAFSSVETEVGSIKDEEQRYQSYLNIHLQTKDMQDILKTLYELASTYCDIDVVKSKDILSLIRGIEIGHITKLDLVKSHLQQILHE